MSRSQLRAHRKSKLEEAVKRLNMSKGVYGVLVTTEEWTVIETTFDHHLTHYWKKQMRFVEQLGTAVIRDPDPKNELQFLRIQTRKYEILLSIAKDHRVLVVFSGADLDPLAGVTKILRSHRKTKRDKKKTGMKIRAVMNPCRPHTIRIGGHETVTITEKVAGKEIPQKEDY
ncbi:unnamed protein product [Orchesella dallaii]|uniref:Uncharacterized protein n=1 Tax=Orchesella dallaii TaxID=48710 RepID=A0ABP1RM67_9HEXA